MSEKAKVYFTNFRVGPKTTILQKLRKLVIAAGMTDIDFENKFTAIKIHFGEPGNVAY
ncbi:MAG: 4Fe-4S ferredoxin, partial [Eubacterium sp.]